MRDDRQRLDKWIWFARFARTRTAAQELIEAGHVRIGGRRETSAAHGLRCGDVLTIAAPHATMVVRVIGLGVRRGDAASVSELYEPVGPG
ncbi:MAG: S4 domain-containing protein [Hyphomicrobiales bacterium]|jgi:ribosome-associated heat shock protein Hsp15|nr:S4 domain-containing protein [Hyphomicrobiales bacterium]